jgi:hypothetical protein
VCGLLVVVVAVFVWKMVGNDDSHSRCRVVFRFDDDEDERRREIWILFLRVCTCGQAGVHLFVCV